MFCRKKNQFVNLSLLKSFHSDHLQQDFSKSIHLLKIIIITNKISSLYMYLSLLKMQFFCCKILIASAEKFQSVLCVNVLPRTAA